MLTVAAIRIEWADNMAKSKASLSEAIERDLRLDFLRGLGLWMIFLDHIPDDVVSWLTMRNYGFSDAAEFFVFISGYLAGFIYGPIVKAGNLLAATKRLWMRAWQMYVAHILLFLAFTAQIARAAQEIRQSDVQGRVQRRQLPRPSGRADLARR